MSIFLQPKNEYYYNNILRARSCLPPFCDGAKDASSLHNSLFASSRSFFRGPFRRPNHCYYRRSPRSHTRFFSLAHPRASPIRMVSSTLGDRFRSSQLHFFPGRGKNKTMISYRSPPAPNNAGRPQKPQKRFRKIHRRDRRA